MLSVQLVISLRKLSSRLTWANWSGPAFIWVTKSFGIPLQMKRTPIGPAPRLENADFWSHAVGRCLNCRSEVYARIEIRSNKVDKIILVQSPPEHEAFDFLNLWGLID